MKGHPFTNFGIPSFVIRGPTVSSWFKDSDATTLYPRYILCLRECYYYITVVGENWRLSASRDYYNDSLGMPWKHGSYGQKLREHPLSILFEYYRKNKVNMDY